MKYIVVKRVNGDFRLSDNILLTNESPSVIVDAADIDKIPLFNKYNVDNPVCRVSEIKEELEEEKTSKKIK